MHFIQECFFNVKFCFCKCIGLSILYKKRSFADILRDAINLIFPLTLPTSGNLPSVLTAEFTLFFQYHALPSTTAISAGVSSYKS